MELCSMHTIRPLLERHGFRFSKAMGQNFLVADWVPREIAAGSGAEQNCGVLEIGPGVGCLTQELAVRAGRVAAVELDRRLIPVLAETVGGLPNVEIVQGDAMQLDLRAFAAEKFAGLRPMVCANLPYNITTPVLTAILESEQFETVTVMIQREVAKRICAPAGSADYGAFTVFVNYYTEPEILFEVPPGCFVPQPKVTSAVVRMRTRTSPPVQADQKLFFKVVRASFAQRRKTLVNGLSGAFGQRLAKTQLEQVVADCGFDLRVRGETLDLASFAAVTNRLEQVLK